MTARWHQDKNWHQETTRTLREGAEARGRWAEEQAALHLQALKFKILATRAKTAVGEVDLIAQRKNLLVFVEVKFREACEDGLWSILPRQQQRIARAAQAWLATRPKLDTFDMRFDAIIVNAQGVSAHVEDAFRPDF